MVKFIRSYWKTLLFFTTIGLVGGFFVGIYQLENYPAEIQQQLIDEMNNSGLGNFPVDIVLGIVSAYQSALYGFVLGAIGILLGILSV